MTSQNPTPKDSNTLTTATRDSVRKPAEPPENERELTDEEIAAVVGGVAVNFSKMLKM